MFEAQEIFNDRYQLQKQLGTATAEGQTWLALDLSSQTEVTIKLLAFSRQLQGEELRIFEQKAEILQTLDHPRIPKYRDYFYLDKCAGRGIPWFGLVRDYVEGFSLLELLEQGKDFSEQHLRSIAATVLEILAYLHQLNQPVLHGNIKPSNLILGKDKQIYLVDFGAVQAQAAVMEITFTVVGTGGYTPLEQFWGRAVPASDLYALGATVIHLLTGIVPAKLPQKESRIQFSDRAKLQSNFVSWIEKITDIDLETRFPNAVAALNALQAPENYSDNLAQFSALESISQPEKANFNIRQSENKLIIDIPHSHLIGWRDYSIWFFLVLVKLIVFKKVFIFKITPNYNFWFILVVLTLSLYLVLFVFEGTKIYLSSGKLSLEKYLFNLSYGKREFKSRDILNVKVEPYQEVLLFWIRLYKILSIRTNGEVYNLAKISRLNNCENLVVKMNNWLNLKQ